MSPDGCTLLFGALPIEFRFSPEQKRVLRLFAGSLYKRVAGQRPFTCLITDDLELQRLNRQFLAHDYPTDVLSFPSQDGNDSLGEIAVSVERAAAQAREFGHDRLNEIRILMLHGVLHLTGMDHERDRGEMAQAEREWRAEFGLPATLTERACMGAQHS
jgi:probable rRNA maturation factor